MYLPRSKYSQPIYSRGDSLFLPSGKAYTGWYFETYDGRYFTGKTPTKTSEELTEDKHTDLFISAKRFTNDLIIPTELDYKNEFITRYFMQDKRNKSIIEVKKKKFEELNKFQHIQGIKIKWNLKAPAENINQGSYIYFGSAAKNKELILDAEKTISGLSKTINNYGEFVK